METLTIKVDPDVDPLSLSVKQVIANSPDVDNLEYILAEFDADLDENDMPDDYNLSLKAYLEQNTYLPLLNVILFKPSVTFINITLTSFQVL